MRIFRSVMSLIVEKRAPQRFWHGKRAIPIVLFLGVAVFETLSSAQDKTAPDGSKALSADEFLSMVETTAAQFRSIRLSFRTRYQVPGEATPHLEQEGQWWYRQDGFERLEVQQTKPGQSEPAILSVRIKTPTRSVSQLNSSQDGGAAQAHIKPATTDFFAEEAGMPLSFFPLPVLQQKQKEAIRASFVMEWEETIEGKRCLKVSFVPKNGEGIGVRYTYWIDEERDHQIVRYGLSLKGQQVLLFHIRLQQIPSGLWFPIYGRIEDHYDLSGEKPVVADETKNIGEYEIDPASIQINGEIDEKVFDIDNFKPSTLVVDHEKGQHYFAGGVTVPGTPTPPPSQEKLDEVLRDADAQKAAIEATSLTRAYGRNWPYWVLGTASLIMVSVGIVLVLRSRGS